ncbi:ABC transporter ATP-binding protein [Lachnospiraceae bacterium 48-33]
MAVLIEVNNLSFSFGEKQILKDISLTVEKEDIIGLLGPSGAGKTTLVNILTRQLKLQNGVIKTFHNRNLISGIMMDSFGLYDRLTVWDNLKIFADIYQVPHSRIETLLNRAELINDKKTIVNHLSKGMRNRVNFCRALLKDMDILYLDEPTSGLDPATTDKIHKLIEEERKTGTTIFLTTHNMHEAEKLCNKIILLNEGTVIEQGIPEEICMKYNIENTLELVLKNGEKHILQNNRENAAILFEMMKDEKIISIHSSEPDLEKVFLYLTGRKLNE